MKISTRGRYGLRALIDIAMHSNGNYVPLSSIAERQDLSLNYLESVFWALKNAGIVLSSIGLQGGYMLALAPEKITVEMILSVLEGDLSVLSKEKKEESTSIRSFLNQAVWEAVDDAVLQILKTTTVQMLIDEYRNQNHSTNSCTL